MMMMTDCEPEDAENEELMDTETVDNESSQNHHEKTIPSNHDTSDNVEIFRESVGVNEIVQKRVTDSRDVTKVLSTHSVSQ